MLVVLGLVGLLAAGPAAAEINAPEAALAERVLGRADAPVSILEYASLTCPHCAAFHRDTLPALKTAYIDTGKARLIYRDFPLDRLALVAAMLARCAPGQRYFGFIEVLFRLQDQWSRAADPRAALMRIARTGGLSESDFDACLDQDSLVQGIRAAAEDASRRHNIRSTPTFVIGEQTISGAASLEDFKTVIDKALAQSGGGAKR
jgi:protein-disulfide isomerase